MGVGANDHRRTANVYFEPEAMMKQRHTTRNGMMMMKAAAKQP